MGRLSAVARKAKAGSLTTEYSANGSFYRPHTRSVHGPVACSYQRSAVSAQLGRPVESRWLQAESFERQFRVSYGQATKGVR
jgi:hypothetical protein